MIIKKNIKKIINKIQIKEEEIENKEEIKNKVKNKEVIKELNEYDKYIPNHPKREKVYNNILNLLEMYDSKLEINNIQHLALNIELGIFNYALEKCKVKEWNYMFGHNYIGRAVTIYNNLNCNGLLKNKNLIKKIIKKEITMEELSEMESKDLFPERRDEILKLCEGYDNSGFIEQPKLEDRPDGAFKCNKCKSWKTTYVEYQSRSADEPTSKRVLCYSCNHRWKFC